MASVGTLDCDFHVVQIDCGQRVLPDSVNDGGIEGQLGGLCTGTRYSILEYLVVRPIQAPGNPLQARLVRGARFDRENSVVREQFVKAERRNAVIGPDIQYQAAALLCKMRK